MGVDLVGFSHESDAVCTGDEIISKVGGSLVKLSHLRFGNLGIPNPYPCFYNDETQQNRYYHQEKVFELNRDQESYGDQGYEEFYGSIKVMGFDGDSQQCYFNSAGDYDHQKENKIYSYRDIQ
jgi:hypothetical protein